MRKTEEAEDVCISTGGVKPPFAVLHATYTGIYKGMIARLLPPITCSYADAVAESEDMVAIVDDDQSVRVALQGPDEIGGSAQAFASAEEFLNSGQQQETASLIADIRLPGMSGTVVSPPRRHKIQALTSDIQSRIAA